MKRAVRKNCPFCFTWLFVQTRVEIQSFVGIGCSFNLVGIVAQSASNQQLELTLIDLYCMSQACVTSASECIKTIPDRLVLSVTRYGGISQRLRDGCFLARLAYSSRK
jgi:hypothetical protein